MITIRNIDPSEPYLRFKKCYEDAVSKNQPQPEAMAISSYDIKSKEVDCRFVNLKYILGDEWIFFSNYNSQKSKHFKTHDQISCTFYWQKTDTQIRLKSKIYITSTNFSDTHFDSRSWEKNALSINSQQSEEIDSYQEILENYRYVYENKKNDKKRPKYWGGYSFKPYYFEYWQGHESRINNRECFSLKDDGKWSKYVLQP